jgi:uncharacterized circularly permuted ATP-grasp superfamily protein/uncharacterized alpha-E superfamily protein
MPGRILPGSTAPAATPDASLTSYLPVETSYDEAITSQGQPRPHWETFFQSVGELGYPEMARRWRDAQQLIRENGVTYNVYGDPRGIARPWQLDPVPLLIDPAEASFLDRGLKQRAQLLEAILVDLYGPQTLLRNGLIPPELVYPNPNFLRPCHGIRLPGGRFLHLYAANLGRGSDGRTRVLGDRTQAPSGAGYALENRIVMTRTLPEAFRECRVHRLALFFRVIRDTLRSLAPRNKDNPRIVLLTPGPYNETYFEHAYLARYLGITLVEGGDLTCRDNRVFLKVLGGLQPVDVIFRRMDDDFCDPLELRPDSFLGVPGLTEAVRSGNVAVANALGSGLLETPALMAYLPLLCRHFFGQDLMIESVPTWWCGDPLSLSHVLANLDDLVIKTTFPSNNADPVFPAMMPTERREVLVNRIKAQPHLYVAEEIVDLSSTPVLVDGTLSPRKMVMRAYLAADKDKEFAVMPGGLTRVGAKPGDMVVSMQRGGGSKDTWVLATGPVSDFTMMANASRIELSRGGGDLPSRSADNLFWLGRYAERAEATTRLLRGIVVRLAERSGVGEAPELPALLRALPLTASQPDPSLDFAEKIAFHATFDPNHATSLVAIVRTLRRVAGVVRDLISIDMWRVLNGLSDFPSDQTAYGEEGPTPADVLDLLNKTIIPLAAFGGLAVESMTRGAGWRFLDIGRKIERSMQIVSLLKGTITRPGEQEVPVLDAVLEIADSGMTYRRRYLSSLRAEAVIDLLVLDDTNPRSLVSQLMALEDDVNHLPRTGTRVGRAPEQRLALTALNEARLSEPDSLALIQDGLRPNLLHLLERIGTLLPQLSETITQQFLSLLQTSRHLSQDG